MYISIIFLWRHMLLEVLFNVHIQHGSYLMVARDLERIDQIILFFLLRHSFNSPFIQLAIRYNSPFIQLARHLYNSPFVRTRHSYNSPFIWLAIRTLAIHASQLHNSPFARLTIHTTHHSHNLPFAQLAIRATRHLHNSPFVQPCGMNCVRMVGFHFTAWLLCTNWIMDRNSHFE